MFFSLSRYGSLYIKQIQEVVDDQQIKLTFNNVVCNCWTAWLQKFTQEI
jgi:hypothetical protein